MNIKDCDNFLIIDTQKNNESLSKLKKITYCLFILTEAAVVLWALDPAERYAKLANEALILLPNKFGYF